jgi:hypothetical protein
VRLSPQAGASTIALLETTGGPPKRDNRREDELGNRDKGARDVVVEKPRSHECPPSRACRGGGHPDFVWGSSFSHHDEEGDFRVHPSTSRDMMAMILLHDNARHSRAVIWFRTGPRQITEGARHSRETWPTAQGVHRLLSTERGQSVQLASLGADVIHRVCLSIDRSA